MKVWKTLRSWLGGRLIGSMPEPLKIGGPIAPAPEPQKTYEQLVREVFDWRRAGCPKDRIPPQLYDPTFDLPGEPWIHMELEDPRSLSYQVERQRHKGVDSLDWGGRKTDVVWSGHRVVPEEKPGPNVIRHPDGRLTEFL